LELREAFLGRLLAVMSDSTLDALALPTTPIPAPLIGEETTRLTRHGNHPTRALLLRNNRPANLGGLPAISVPCGRTTEGLPIGLQLIGSVMDEALLLRVAHAFELAHPPLHRPLA
jgi:aspartyl-tRNA(Asn)/glutamyl-tRNA(Gln) amidotransferase subunit A